MGNIADIERNRLALRVAAMRTADSLSRLYGADQANKTWDNKSGFRNKERLWVSVPLTPASWPVLDADALTWDLDDETSFLMPDDGAEPVIWPVKAGVVFPGDNGSGRIATVETVNPADVRGRVKLFGRHMIKSSTIDFDGGSRVTDYGSGYFIRRGGVWVDAMGGAVSMPHFGHSSQKPTTFPSLVIGHVLRQRYEWSSVFHFPTGLRLRFGCSAEAVLELYRDRDKPGGDARRRALLHWVRRHWRKTRFSQSDAVAEVRKHMRGETGLTWRGMDVTIVPAMYEVEAAA